MSRKTIKKKGRAKLKSLLPKKKAFIILMPEEKDENIHWLFWILMILIIIFLISLVFINWQESSTWSFYLNY